MESITLQFIHTDYTYIARDKDNALYVFSNKPILDEEFQKFYTTSDNKFDYVDESLFSQQLFKNITFDNSPLIIKR